MSDLSYSASRGYCFSFLEILPQTCPPPSPISPPPSPPPAPHPPGQAGYCAYGQLSAVFADGAPLSKLATERCLVSLSCIALHHLCLWIPFDPVNHPSFSHIAYKFSPRHSQATVAILATLRPSPAQRRSRTAVAGASRWRAASSTPHRSGRLPCRRHLLPRHPPHRPRRLRHRRRPRRHHRQRASKT